MSMSVPRRYGAAVLLLLLTCVATRAATATTDDRAVDNLAAFARAYGYVRFFHPSDEAAALDWDKFAIHGADIVRERNDDRALGEALRHLFAPVGAGGLAILNASDEPVRATIAGDASGRVTYWQHHGVELSKDSNIYKSRRVLPSGTGNRAPLFDARPPPPLVEKPIGSGLRLRLALVLPVSTADRTPPADERRWNEVQRELSRLDSPMTFDDWRVRAAGVIIAWNVFQHFHPYIDRVGIAWSETLRPALRKALADRTRLEYYATLAELVARLQDGHGYVYGRDVVGGIPLRVARIENQIVVTGTEAGTPWRPGDVVLALDGVPALEVLSDRERHVSGSPHLRSFRALNQYGEGPLGTTARLELLRDGRRQSVEFARAPDRRNFFFNSIPEFAFAAYDEVRPGIFYVNLRSIRATELASKLPELARARGVIFDHRMGGRTPNYSREDRVAVHQHVIPHLIQKTVQASPMLTPLIVRPDREAWTYRESTWPVQPKAPRLTGRVVFINEPPVVSYGETCMAMISGYKLATLVGAATAGCNGNANYIPLPGGFRIMWTGMEVIRHDRTPFYGVGFVPDHPVARTIAAVKAGRDEYLEKALEVIMRETPPPRVR